MAVLSGFKPALLALTIRSLRASASHVAGFFSWFSVCRAGSASKRPCSAQLQRMRLGGLRGFSVHVSRLSLGFEVTR